jgi:hypothetical protein
VHPIPVCRIIGKVCIKFKAYGPSKDSYLSELLCEQEIKKAPKTSRSSGTSETDFSRSTAIDDFEN